MQPLRDPQTKALELTMQDVMDNLEDTASYLALTCPAGLEILSIEPPGRNDPFMRQEKAELHLHPGLVHQKYA